MNEKKEGIDTHKHRITHKSELEFTEKCTYGAAHNSILSEC